MISSRAAAGPGTVQTKSSLAFDSSAAPDRDQLWEDAGRGMARARDHLLSLQRPDGHWCAELEGDTILESEFVLLHAFLGNLGDPRIVKCARYLLSKQDTDGGWSNYPGGPTCISTTVKAYFALKIAGHSPDSEPLVRARHRIRALGGAESVNSFTRFYLAALGQIPYRHCPSVPPELVLLPQWFPVNLYQMSSWTRTIVVPLSIFYAFKPVTRVPDSMGIAELFLTPPDEQRLPDVSRVQGKLISWPNFFRLVDRGLKVYSNVAPNWLRRRAVDAAKKWMLERFDGSDGLGAIFPPMVYTIIALRCLGYPDDSPEVKWAHKQLDDLILEEEDAIRVQPCFSPIWDTAIAMIALGEAGVERDDPAMTSSADWLLAREIRQPGDWAKYNPNLEPSGWAFEYNNRFYADLDDTAMVLMALRHTARFSDPDCRQAMARALDFLHGMQNTDHGWAAFDQGINNRILEAIPFADHNAMLDPSCADITARVLEMLGKLGYRRGEPAIENAIRFIFDHQDSLGCWEGRWGVNYIYGTWQSLLGIEAIGFDMDDPRVRKAADWLVSVQQADGGWGESCRSYDDRSWIGRGPATASQTAWAVMGLIHAGRADSRAVKNGIEYLLRTQRSDGSWEEPYFTGTGFPKVFYLRYHYYRIYFPLLALARYRAASDLADAVDSGNHGAQSDEQLVETRS